MKKLPDGWCPWGWEWCWACWAWAGGIPCGYCWYPGCPGIGRAFGGIGLLIFVFNSKRRQLINVLIFKFSMAIKDFIRESRLYCVFSHNFKLIKDACTNENKSWRWQRLHIMKTKSVVLHEQLFAISQSKLNFNLTSPRLFLIRLGQYLKIALHKK